MSTKIVMPNLGAAANEAVLVNWRVKEGEHVVVGQPLYEVETDKSIVEVEAVEAGVIGRLLVQQGDLVPIGSPIALLLSEGEALADVDPGAQTDLVRPQGALVSAAVRSQAGKPKSTGPQGGPNVSPRARRLAHQRGIDLEGVVGTGPGGRVSERDVLDALPSPAEVPVGGAIYGDTSEPQGLAVGHPFAGADEFAGLTGPRVTIARRMAASARQVAAVTLSTEVIADGLARAVRQLRLQCPHVADGITVDLIVGALVARGLREHPDLNATLTPSGIERHAAVHLGIALDAARGLVVPVLRDADSRSLVDLAGAWQGLRARTLKGAATPEELSGGTFTITNLGTLGIDAFTPIINLGESAILGIGRMAERPWVVGTRVVIARTITLSLTFDHRIVDGAPAARFLVGLSNLLQHPEDVL